MAPRPFDHGLARMVAHGLVAVLAKDARVDAGFCEEQLNLVVTCEASSPADLYELLITRLDELLTVADRNDGQYEQFVVLALVSWRGGVQT